MQKYWSDTKKASLIERLRNTITLRSFSAPCSDFSTNSVRIISNGNNQDLVRHDIISNTDFTTAVTVEAWVKLNRFPAIGSEATIFHRNNASLNNFQIKLCVNPSGCIQFALGQGNAYTTLTSDLKIDISTWVFITGTWDGTTISIFKNGIKDTNTHALAGNLDANLVSPVHFLGHNATNIHYFNGWLAEVRVWNTAKTRQDILNTYTGPRNYNYGSGVDDDLIYYYKCNDSSSSTNIIEWVNGETASFVGSFGGLVSDDGPPLIYGASFVIAAFDYTLAQSCSLNYPVTAPDDVNFALIVRWTDDNDIIQRRALWTVDGVDIAPNPAPYRGERLPVSFTLEAWNIDGAATVDLEGDLVIETSLITKPTSSIDLAEPNLSTVSSNKAIASLFPLAFPTLFNTAPTFTLPSSAAPPIPTNVGNVLGESGSALGEGTTGLQ